MPSVLMCVAVQAFAGDPPTAAPATSPQAPSSSSAPASSTPAASTTAPAAATETPHRLVLIDKTLTNAEVSQLLSQGYKPQKGRGDTVLYCRSEAQMGTRCEK